MTDRVSNRVNALRAYRAANNVTLAAFGAIFGVDKSTVLRWEEKRIPVERVMAISKQTGIPPAKLRPDLAALIQS